MANKKVQAIFMIEAQDKQNLKMKAVEEHTTSSEIVNILIKDYLKNGRSIKDYLKN